MVFLIYLHSYHIQTRTHQIFSINAFFVPRGTLEWFWGKLWKTLEMNARNSTLHSDTVQYLKFMNSIYVLITLRFPLRRQPLKKPVIAQTAILILNHPSSVKEKPARSHSSGISLATLQFVYHIDFWKFRNWIRWGPVLTALWIRR